MNTTLILLSGYTRFQLGGYVNSLKTSYWSAENPTLIRHYIMLLLACNVLLVRPELLGPFCFYDIINSHQHVAQTIDTMC
jgi:hypothetical protein